MAPDKFSKVKNTTLVSLIIHGANDFGLSLAKTLSEQGSRVIVIDEFNKDTKTFVAKIKKLGDTDFIAFEGLQDLFKNLSRFDYLFYLQNTLLYEERDFGSKGFLEESNRLETSLKAAAKFDVKTSLVTTILYNKKLVESASVQSIKHSAYSSPELQKYSETLAAEYHDKSKLNIRILRLGTLLGARFNCVKEETLEKLFNDSVNKNQITIEGEGLDNHYLINVKDAIYGILKLTFNNDTSGEVISLANEKPLTTLSIAYKILELNTEANNIKFEEQQIAQAFMQNPYVPAPNGSQYGWSSSISVEETFIETLSGVYETNSKKWNNKPSKKELVTKSTATQSDKDEIKTHPTAESVKTPLGNAVSKFFSPITNIFTRVSPNGADIKSSLNFKNIAYMSISLVLLSILSYFIFTPIITITANSILIYNQREELTNALNTFDLQAASGELDKMSVRMDRISVGIERTEWMFKISRQTDAYDNLSQLTFAATYAIEGAKGMSTALTPLANYAKEFTPAISFGSNQPTTTREYTEFLLELEKNSGQLQKASEDILLASKLIEGVDLQAFPKPLQSALVEIKDQNLKVQGLITPFKSSIQFLPELLGLNERQRYLILLQNPSEIRSTGGWLSSYALVGIENGQIRQLDVDDIYNLDGQLISQDKLFEPPESMSEALDIDTWSFSLSNWNPDFHQAANDAQFFIKESGKAVELDGVITIDVTLIQWLLDEWGGISVPGESELITSENIYSKIFEIHNDFTPGSRQKATFIANLANATLQRLFSSDATAYREISSVILRGLQEKHILVYIKNTDANSYFDSAGWSGRIKQEYASSPIPIEWNWGANKSNLFLTRSSNLEVNILSEDQIQYVYDLSIQNSSETRIYPEGDYINWLRIMLPANATVTSSTGFEDNQSNVHFENGFQVVGGWFNVLFSETNRFKISYTVSRESGEYFPIEVIDNQIEMDLYFFKQPGLDKDKYNVKVTYPSQWSITDTADMNRGVNQLNSQFELNTDKEYELEWEYK